MNVFYSRTLANQIKEQQNKFPILALTGPRQSGKTTLLKELFPDYRYISLESKDNRAFAQIDPLGFLEANSGKVILDEVQRVPDLFSYLQTRVDDSGIMGQYILSGSQNFHLVKSITQTLVGRVALFRLMPFDTEELKQANLLPEHYTEVCFTGFYPALYDRQIKPPVFYFNYLKTYIEKDIGELIKVRHLQSFRTFLGLCAGRAGHLLNLSAMANECNISQPTAKAWLSLLESSYLIFLLYPYHENFNKRLVKTPKLYFYDTGLLCYLLDIRNAEELKTDRMKGNIFENMVVANAQKLNEHHYRHFNFYFWQDSKGLEVDLLQKRGNNFDVYEIKATQTVMPDLFKNMDLFQKIAAPRKVTKTLIYGGDTNQQRTHHNILSWKDQQ